MHYNYTVTKQLKPIEHYMHEDPMSSEMKQCVLQHRREIQQILTGEDHRLLVIVGPCSAWPKEAVLEYAKRLSCLNQTLHSALKCVMRVYIQKPRTTTGWMGPLYQPDPLAAPDIESGIRYTRSMMRAVLELGLPIADEALFPRNANGFLELLSWVAIGARSAENSEHRIFASALDMPVGLKNPTHGSLAVGVNSIIAAQRSHVAWINQDEVQTQGNPYAHLVLRGSQKEPNYSLSHLIEVKQRLHHAAVKNPAVIIDASHDNCYWQGQKDYQRQSTVIFDVLENMKQYPDLQSFVKGFMIESFLKPGKQTVESLDATQVDREGLSITDACLGWRDTETLLCALAESVVERTSSKTLSPVCERVK